MKYKLIPKLLTFLLLLKLLFATEKKHSIYSDMIQTYPMISADFAQDLINADDSFSSIAIHSKDQLESLRNGRKRVNKYSESNQYDDSNYQNKKNNEDKQNQGDSKEHFLSTLPDDLKQRLQQIQAKPAKKVDKPFKPIKLVQKQEQIKQITMDEFMSMKPINNNSKETDKIEEEVQTSEEVDQLKSKQDNVKTVKEKSKQKDQQEYLPLPNKNKDKKQLMQILLMEDDSEEKEISDQENFQEEVHDEDRNQEITQKSENPDDFTEIDNLTESSDSEFNIMDQETVLELDSNDEESTEKELELENSEEEEIKKHGNFSLITKIEDSQEEDDSFETEIPFANFEKIENLQSQEASPQIEQQQDKQKVVETQLIQTKEEDSTKLNDDLELKQSIRLVKKSQNNNEEIKQEEVKPQIDQSQNQKIIQEQKKNSEQNNEPDKEPEDDYITQLIENLTTLPSSEQPLALQYVIENTGIAEDIKFIELLSQVIANGKLNIEPSKIGLLFPQVSLGIEKFKSINIKKSPPPSVKSVNIKKTVSISEQRSKFQEQNSTEEKKQSEQQPISQDQEQKLLNEGEKELQKEPEQEPESRTEDISEGKSWDALQEELAKKASQVDENDSISEKVQIITPSNEKQNETLESGMESNIQDQISSESDQISSKQEQNGSSQSEEKPQFQTSEKDISAQNQEESINPEEVKTSSAENQNDQQIDQEQSQVKNDGSIQEPNISDQQKIEKNTNQSEERSQTQKKDQTQKNEEENSQNTTPQENSSDESEKVNQEKKSQNQKFRDESQDQIQQEDKSEIIQEESPEAPTKPVTSQQNSQEPQKQYEQEPIANQGSSKVPQQEQPSLQKSNQQSDDVQSQKETQREDQDKILPKDNIEKPKDQIQPQKTPQDKFQPSDQTQPKDQVQPQSKIQPKELSQGQGQPSDQIQPQDQIQQSKEKIQPQGKLQSQDQIQPNGQTQPQTKTQPQDNQPQVHNGQQQNGQEDPQQEQPKKNQQLEEVVYEDFAFDESAYFQQEEERAKTQQQYEQQKVPQQQKSEQILGDKQPPKQQKQSENYEEQQPPKQQIQGEAQNQQQFQDEGEELQKSKSSGEYMISPPQQDENEQFTGSSAEEGEVEGKIERIIEDQEEVNEQQVNNDGQSQLIINEDGDLVRKQENEQQFKQDEDKIGVISSEVTKEQIKSWQEKMESDMNEQHKDKVRSHVKLSLKENIQQQQSKFPENEASKAQIIDNPTMIRSEINHQMSKVETNVPQKGVNKSQLKPEIPQQILSQSDIKQSYSTKRYQEEEQLKQFLKDRGILPEESGDEVAQDPEVGYEDEFSDFIRNRIDQQKQKQQEYEEKERIVVQRPAKPKQLRPQISEDEKIFQNDEGSIQYASRDIMKVPVTDSSDDIFIIQSLSSNQRSNVRSIEDKINKDKEGTKKKAQEEDKSIENRQYEKWEQSRMMPAEKVAEQRGLIDQRGAILPKIPLLSESQVQQKSETQVQQKPSVPQGKNTMSLVQQAESKINMQSIRCKDAYNGQMQRAKEFVCIQCQAQDAYILDEESWYLVGMLTMNKIEHQEFLSIVKTLMRQQTTLLSFGNGEACVASENLNIPLNISQVMTLMDQPGSNKQTNKQILIMPDVMSLKYFQVIHSPKSGVHYKEVKLDAFQPTAVSLPQGVQVFSLGAEIQNGIKIQNFQGQLNIQQNSVRFKLIDSSKVLNRNQTLELSLILPRDLYLIEALSNKYFGQDLREQLHQFLKWKEIDVTPKLRGQNIQTYSLIIASVHSEEEFEMNFKLKQNNKQNI